MKTREAIKMVEADGWVMVKQSGSHRRFKHRTKPGKVTIPVHGLNEEIGHALLRSIKRQAGL
ncbi:MAG: type II toxin-antitoxin system HicA family toxin [Phycisphaerales bacterium]|nr:type II toxin-antitoxin system HicA family toxin [Phycisphaerales bacterium]